MKRLIAIIVINLVFLPIYAQREYHVFPANHKVTKGTPNGNGSLAKPWDLQTALNKKEVVKASDIIWLHGGVYKGRFSSSISTNSPSERITIMPFQEETVILDGNVKSGREAVLDVNGDGLVFKDFTVTFQGNFPRKTSAPGFKSITGISHRQGRNCVFQSITIHNVPGSGFGSWKRTGNTKILNCIIYNNGYMGKRGHGVGIYVQNESNEQRLIEGNIIFSNYYKGIQVWSASNGGGKQFVKNIILKDNVVFNAAQPTGRFRDNLIVATGDGSGKHIAKNITVTDNVFYHNTDIKNGEILGGTISVTLGFHRNAPIEDVRFLNNVVVGGKDGLRLWHVKGLEFSGNTIYSEFVRLNAAFLKEDNRFKFSNNSYYTRRANAFRFLKVGDYDLKTWQTELQLDANSTWEPSKAFKTKPVLKLLQIKDRPNEFLVNLLNPESGEVAVDFSNYRQLKGQQFAIYDIENPEKVLKSGQLSEDLQLTINMTEAHKMNTSNLKSSANFGVYKIVFGNAKTASADKKKKESFVERLFRKLGF